MRIKRTFFLLGLLVLSSCDIMLPIGGVINPSNFEKPTSVISNATTVSPSTVIPSTSNTTTTLTSNSQNPTTFISDSNFSISLSIEKTDLRLGQWTDINVTLSNTNYASLVEYQVIEGRSLVKIDNNQVLTLGVGEVEIVATVGGVNSNSVKMTISDLEEDPYVDVNETTFYQNYVPATSYKDAYYRSLHNLMSGSIEDQDQYETILPNRPKEDDKFIKNVGYTFSNEKTVYYVYNSQGEVVNAIFKGGAYVILEEVAPYLTAFNNIPANYTSEKSGYPSSDPWGKYLRLNHSKFSGSTTNYPYEPELPNISGCGGSYTYYELDIGTTGTTCDPSYNATIYNNGSKITRGAARIVYSRFENSKEITIPSKYLFYTNNHYNDFREYLNYENGWGEIFGNITGGGTISSKTDYNPTDYIDVAKKNLVD